ncbi:MAG: 2-keto-4-pentenoate hydratase [Bdellovibrionota bacterium]
MKPREIAEVLFKAEQNGKAVKKFTAAQPDFSLAQGYETQQILLDLHLNSGAKLVGRKMGMTSKPKMQQMGIGSPIHGFLTDRMQIADTASLKLGKRIHPKAEPEIAFVLGKELRGHPSPVELSAAIAGITGAIEIIDSRFENFDFALPDVVADNCSSSGFVLGSTMLKPNGLDLSNLGIIVEKNGAPAQFGSSAAILGNPLRSLLALVALLHEVGEALPPGSIVLAGGATAAIPIEAGDWIRATFDKLGTVEFHVE